MQNAYGFRRGIALLLTFCLLFGTVGSALAATVTQDKPAPVLTDDGGEKKSYVAIGDSYAKMFTNSVGEAWMTDEGMSAPVRRARNTPQ